MSAAFIRSFGELRLSDRPEVGGKCASLGELIHAGVDVPNGFAITVEAFERFRDAAAIRDRLRAIVMRADPDSSAALSQAHREATEIVNAAAFPAEIAAQIRTAYTRLCEAAGTGHGGGLLTEVPVAVRSSTVAEDGNLSSYAGQQETYLWVVGGDAVVEHVRLCWASLYTPQAIAYRTRLPSEQAFEATRISVGVQVMVRAEASGVLFTASPRTGDRSVMAVNASWGLGHAVVSGEVTPDEYWLSKIGPSILSSRLADKQVEYLPDPCGTGITASMVVPARRRAACLSEAALLSLARLGMAVEAHYGSPQDIEWALERSADGSEHIVVLQSRPVTGGTTRQEPDRSNPQGSLTSVLGMIRVAARKSES